MLATAIKGEQHIDGTINPYLANAATKIINNPLFQRVKDRLEDDLIQQKRNEVEHQQFQHSVTNLAVDARINRSDLDYIISNLQQPPPAPAAGAGGGPSGSNDAANGGQPPPSSDAAADRERLIAELDGMAQQRERQLRQEMMAEQNARNLAAQSVATPAQEIIREFHTQQPIYIPTPQVPQQIPINVNIPQQDYSEMMRQFGMTMQQLFLSQQQMPTQRPSPDSGEDIPITITNQGPPPGAPPGGGRILARSYGPSRLPRERLAPFMGGGPPPAPGGMTAGGVTAPMPVRQRQTPRPAPPAPAPPRFPGRGQKLPDQPAFTPFSGRAQRLPDEPQVVTPTPPRPPKRKGYDLGGGVKIPKTSRFQGRGQKLPDEPAFTPFSGRAQRLPGENDLRANAIQRMREIAEQGRQRARAAEMVDRMGDLRRAMRRGGARGDVVGPGKRKREEDTFEPNPRARRGDISTGPQRFSIAT